jgi:hypothetical protein
MAVDSHPSLGLWVSTRFDGKNAYGSLLLVAEACGKVVCGVMAPRSLTRPPWAGKCGKRNRAAGWLRGGRTVPVAVLLAILRRFLLDASSCLAMLSFSSGVCTDVSNARLAALAWYRLKTSLVAKSGETSKALELLAVTSLLSRKIVGTGCSCWRSIVASGVDSATGVAVNPSLRFLRAGSGNISVGANPATKSTGCLIGGKVLQLKP